MILRAVRLDNIRSYLSQEIQFPEGQVLLSGDIGSGKSTILLAIDFALFGIQRDLTGASLLRHGKEQGSVELDFIVGKKEYSIKRTLKRSKDSVRQSAGHIISDGTKTDLTAQESKSFILSLLGYPPQALKKDSALLYRYTVYTPQEQMKGIIEADPEERLDLIRRLFGMDRYKRIAENSESYAKELRSRVRELAGSISDLSLKTRERDELEKTLLADRKKLEELKNGLKIQEDIVKKKKNEVDELAKKIEQVNKMKQEYSSLRAEFDVLKSESSRMKAAHDETEPKIKDVEQKLSAFKEMKKPESTLQDLSQRIASLEKEEREGLSKIASLETEIASLSKILDKGICGTCRQKVADRDGFKKGIEEKEGEIKKLVTRQKASREQIVKLREDSVSIQTYESKMRELRSLEERKKDLVESISRYRVEITSKQVKMKSLAERINSLAKELKEDSNSAQFKEKQGEYEELRAVREKMAREESTVEEKIRGLNSRLASIKSEISAKEEAKGRMEQYIFYENWIRDFFVKLMGTIEKHVLVSVQQEFNSLFQKWFSMLVMDENMSARVDDRFSVIIEQNGFETEYAFMSGGERTAIALAYRLALNRVINDLIERIRTKDLMILDEPTDGFSSDQMNSVRDVLSELGTRQTIIVSHEPKIESFVESTLRFVKENGISRAVV